VIRTDIKKLIQQAIKSHWDVDLALGEIKIDYPPENFGDYSTNIAMKLAKVAKSDSMETAEDIAEHLRKSDLFERIEVAKPGFINFYLSPEVLKKAILDINEQGSNFGDLEKKDKKIMVEYSQPNTHKEFHIGHLRNVFIGSALINVLRKSGYEVVAANYIGDTGTHIAKCLWALNKFHGKENFDGIENKTEFLGKVYSEAVQKIEDNPEYGKEFKETQKKFEEGDKDLVDLWKKTKQWSLDEFNSIYEELGAIFDVYFYESEEELAGKKIVSELVENGIAKESEGAVIVDLESYDLGVLVLLRSDGSALYGLKDIPLSREKFEKYKIDRSIIIADIRQNLYFQQIFKIMELMGFNQDMAHIGYGFVALKGGVGMSSRKGNVIPARMLLREVKEEVKKKFPETPVASEVALGAIKFYMLKHSNESNIEFDINESIKLEGATGPYLQYAYARISGIIRKSDTIGANEHSNNANYNLLSDKNEISLIRKLLIFPEIVEDVAEGFQINRLAQYALELVRDFHRFYEACKVIDEKNADLTLVRLSLVKATQVVLQSALRLMGIEAVERM
jgi:arginyl-tRNA synthetase